MVNDEISPEVIDLRRDEMTDFNLARKEVAELILEVELGAQITLDKSRVLGVAPLVEPIYEVPGPHIIEARIGERAVMVTHIAARGQEHHIKLSLPPISAELVGERAEKKVWWPVALGGGVTVAALGTGIALHVASNSAANDYRITMDRLKADQYRRDPLGPRGCGQLAFHPDCETARAHDDRSVAFGNASTALFIASGALSVMTAGLFIYEEYRVSVRPAVGGLGGSVVW
ncbi:MAG: hypothetical protein L6Q76_22090 [Polyangiaceae bacterium]|nr:hypothetical protein [Polyangiaceae bacterium]